jgi:hypothetical protein
MQQHGAASRQAAYFAAGKPQLCCRPPHRHACFLVYGSSGSIVSWQIAAPDVFFLHCNMSPPRPHDVQHSCSAGLACDMRNCAPPQRSSCAIGVAQPSRLRRIGAAPGSFRYVVSMRNFTAAPVISLGPVGSRHSEASQLALIFVLSEPTCTRRNMGQQPATLYFCILCKVVVLLVDSAA